MGSAKRREACEWERRGSTLLFYAIITMCVGAGLGVFSGSYFLPTGEISNHPVPFALLVAGGLLFVQSIVLLGWLISDWHNGKGTKHVNG